MYELTIIILSVLTTMMNLARFLIAYDISQILKKDVTKYINISYTILMDDVAGYLIGIISFMGILKLLKLLRFSRTVTELFVVINVIVSPLLMFLMLFMIMLLSFAIGMWLLLGTQLYAFRNIVTAVETLLALMLSKYWQILTLSNKKYGSNTI